LVVMGLRDIERRIPIRGEEGGEGEGSGFREPLMGPVRSDVSCTRRALLSRGLTEASHAAAGEGRGSGTTVPVESQRGDRGLEGDTDVRRSASLQFRWASPKSSQTPLAGEQPLS
jgi:hypothetical protein